MYNKKSVGRPKVEIPDNLILEIQEEYLKTKSLRKVADKYGLNFKTLSRRMDELNLRRQRLTF